MKHRAISFNVPGRPIGKERPRFNRKTGRAYTPMQTRGYETEVAYSCLQWQGTFTGPVRMSLWIYTKGKADIDNIEKSVLDGIQQAGVYENDSQVREKHTYMPPDFVGEERVEVMIEDVGDD